MNDMKKIYTKSASLRCWAVLLLAFVAVLPVVAQADSLEVSLLDGVDATAMGSQGLRQVLKTKFIEGNVYFMSLVALVLVLGLTMCIERIIYLTLAKVNVHSFLQRLKDTLGQGGRSAAVTLCRQTRGPVAALCLHALEQGGRPAAEVERSLQSHGAVLTSQLERGCSWIKLFIAMAPSLGFLGTVIGMVMAFDQIQQSNDFGASTVAAGMKVALITTIFGIIVALVLQLFYNYILTRIDALVDDMEVASEEMLSIES